MSDKPEALKLAEIVDSFDARSEHMPLEIYGIISSELLRLNAVNQELLAVNKNWEVSDKEDGIWLILHGTGTTRRGAFRLADTGSCTIVAQVLRLLDADRRAAIAKATGETT